MQEEKLFSSQTERKGEKSKTTWRNISIIQFYYKILDLDASLVYFYPLPMRKYLTPWLSHPCNISF